MRVFSGVMVGLLLATSPVYVAQADEVAAPRAEVEAVDVGSAAVPAADDGSSDLVAELPARRTDDFGLVGVTWDRGFDDTGMTVEVRLRTSGTWDAWEELAVESEEGDAGRDGTEPLWVGSSDGIGVRVTSPSGRRPAGLRVATIDPGTTPAEAAGASAAAAPAGTLAAQAADGSPSYTAKPSIISRSSWGARRNTYCDSPRTGDETRGVVVHHTAGSNSYTRSQSASIVRAVQAYHMDGRDWCDIGYNFLVDRFGQIFEGRNGGVDQPVRGAHAGAKNVNTYTMGVSMMGTFTSSPPTSATKDAMVRLIGWRIGTTFHPAKGEYGIGSYRLQRIAGHRDVVGTACPGKEGYAWLSASGGLRDRVAAYVASYSSPIRTRFRELGTGRTGPVRVGEYPFTTGPGGRKARLANVDLYSSPSGTYSVSDHFRTEYAAVKEQTGRLGVPTSGTQPTTRATMRVQRFANGSIYRVSRTTTRAYALFGALDARYQALGAEQSALGAPTTREAPISGGRYRATFALGHMTVQADGRVTVAIH